VYVFLCHIPPPTPFPCHLSPPTVTTPAPLLPGKTCSTLLFSDFVEEKRKKSKFLTFFEIKVATRQFPCDISQYICIIYFYIYFSPLCLSPFLMMFSEGLRIKPPVLSHM
jgi:hypothetical protein